MTKAQNFTFDIMDTFLASENKTIAWSEIVEQVKAKHRVKNWMTIRAVLQVFISEKSIARTSDLRVEEYQKIS